MKKRTLESFDPARRRCLGFNSKTDTGAVSSATSSGQYLQFFFNWQISKQSTCLQRHSSVAVNLRSNSKAHRNSRKAITQPTKFVGTYPELPLE